MDGFKGLLFTLKKRMQNPNHSDNEHYKHVVFGFYDGLDINCVEQWYGMRPKGLVTHKSVVQLDVPFADQYTVRALFPQDADKLEEEGFSYSLFEKLGANKEEKEFTQYPLMTMALINVSEEFIRKCNGLEVLDAQMLEFVRESLKMVDSSTLKCAVFPSIGYSDYIVAFMAKDFEQVAIVIDDLRTKCFADKSVAFSSCYTVCGFYKNVSPSNILNNMNVHLSIRVNLREGISSKYFMKKFKEAAEMDLKKKGFDNGRVKELFLNWKDEYYSTFGNADSLFLPEHNLDAYLPLYLDGFILNPGESFFKNYITNIRTSIRVNGKILNDYVECGCIEPHKEKDKIIADYQKQFREFIDHYEQFVGNNNLHIRISKSLQQLMKNFLNIAQLSHCFDVEKILGKAFISLMDNMEYIFKNADEIRLYDVDEALNEFRNIMGIYLSDLIRSDKLFIEGQTLTHPSIGSATKLLFAYNHLTKLITEQLVNMESNPIEKFNFLITSGGCDKTTSTELFEFLGVCTNCLNLVIITIPEMSLYDVKGTLFRIAHEFLHFCGERNRKARLKHILKSIFYWTAVDICDIFFNDDERIRFLSYINPYLDEKSGDYDLVTNKVSQLFETMRRESVEEIADVLYSEPYFSEYGRGNADEQLYYLFEIENVFLKDSNVAGEFLADVTEEGTIQNKIYYVIVSKMRNFHKEIIVNLKSWGIHYSEFNSLYLWDEYELKCKKKDSTTAMFIRAYFQIYMGGLECQEEFMDLLENTAEYLEVRCNILETMRESYADCMAAKILNIKFTDFIFGFVYEQWNMEAAFPDTSASVLRIGADLKILFGLSGELNAGYADKIRERAGYWKDRGYEYKNVEQLIIKTDYILHQYEDRLCSYGLTTEIETYLSECIAEMDTTQFKEIQELCKVSDLACPDDTYKMVDFLFRQWEGLINEG